MTMKALCTLLVLILLCWFAGGRCALFGPSPLTRDNSVATQTAERAHGIAIGQATLEWGSVILVNIVRQCRLRLVARARPLFHIKLLRYPAYQKRPSISNSSLGGAHVPWNSAGANDSGLELSSAAINVGLDNTCPTALRVIVQRREVLDVPLRAPAENTALRVPSEYAHHVSVHDRSKLDRYSTRVAVVRSLDVVRRDKIYTKCRT